MSDITPVKQLRCPSEFHRARMSGIRIAARKGRRVSACGEREGSLKHIEMGERYVWSSLPNGVWVMLVNCLVFCNQNFSTYRRLGSDNAIKGVSCPRKLGCFSDYIDKRSLAHMNIDLLTKIIEYRHGTHCNAADIM